MPFTTQRPFQTGRMQALDEGGGDAWTFLAYLYSFSLSLSTQDSFTFDFKGRRVRE